MANSKVELKRNINFFTVLGQYEQEKQKTTKSGKSNVVLAFAIAVMLLGGYTFYMAYQDKQLTKSITELQGFVENDENAAAFAGRSKIKSDINALTAYNRACITYITQLKEKPRVEGVSFAQAKKQLPINVSITEFSYTDPVLTVRCETTDKNAPSKFAESLTKSGDFVSVTYDGFDSLGQMRGDVYTFAIECVLW